MKQKSNKQILKEYILDRMIEKNWNFANYKNATEEQDKAVKVIFEAVEVFLIANRKIAKRTDKWSDDVLRSAKRKIAKFVR